MSSDMIMFAVPETPWHNLGASYQTPPKTSKEIMEGAKLDFTVSTEKMETTLHGKIPGWHTVYREDNNELLGVVHTGRPNVVQNVDAFGMFDKLIGDKVEFDAAGSLGGGAMVFGAFLVKEQYRVLDEDIDHYLLVINDHLKPDGKVTILNTPVRVVCQNMIGNLLYKSLYQMRMPVTSDEGVRLTLTNKMFDTVNACKVRLNRQAEALVQQKIDHQYVSGLLDTLFPLIKVGDTDEVAINKTNERIEAIRSQFLSDCMNADNLGNFRGTAYQAFGAVTDFATHYFSKPEKAYDLGARMKVLPGIAADSPSALVTKFLTYNQRKMA